MVIPQHLTLDASTYNLTTSKPVGAMKALLRNAVPENNRDCQAPLQHSAPNWCLCQTTPQRRGIRPSASPHPPLASPTRLSPLPIRLSPLPTRLSPPAQSALPSSNNEFLILITGSNTEKCHRLLRMDSPLLCSLGMLSRISPLAQ